MIKDLVIAGVINILFAIGIIIISCLDNTTIKINNGKLLIELDTCKVKQYVYDGPLLFYCVTAIVCLIIALIIWITFKLYSLNIIRL